MRVGGGGGRGTASAISNQLLRSLPFSAAVILSHLSCQA